METLAPAFANANVIERPMPRLPPATITRFIWKSNCTFSAIFYLKLCCPAASCR
jgi:hypothetical protein